MTWIDPSNSKIIGFKEAQRAESTFQLPFTRIAEDISIERSSWVSSAKKKLRTGARMFVKIPLCQAQRLSQKGDYPSKTKDKIWRFDSSFFIMEVYKIATLIIFFIRSSRNTEHSVIQHMAEAVHRNVSHVSPTDRNGSCTAAYRCANPTPLERAGTRELSNEPASGLYTHQKPQHKIHLHTAPK